jgi:hypothetical protein
MKVEEFTIEELIKLNVEALKLFKEGNAALISKKTKALDEDTLDYDVQDLAIELMLEILEETADGGWQGLGMLEEIKIRFYDRHLS